MLLLKPFTVDPGRSMVHPRGDPTYVHFHFASKVCHLTTRIRVRLLGPCFKTGWLKPLCQHLKNAGPALHRIKLTLRTNTGVCSNRAESTMGRPLGAFLVPRSPTGHAPGAGRCDPSALQALSPTANRCWPARRHGAGWSKLQP